MIDTERLKQENPIMEVAVKLGLTNTVRDTTVAIHCPSPEHEDRNPSCMLMPEANRFECKACGISGDVIKLVELVCGVDFKDAVTWLGGTKDVEQERPVKKERYTLETYFDEHGINKKMQTKFNLHLGNYEFDSGFKIPSAIIPNQLGEHHRVFSEKQKFLTVGKTTLFKAGDNQGDGETMFLAEGELKAILVYQETGRTCWSGTGGCGTFKIEWKEEFDKAKKIYLVYDNDWEGQVGAKKVAKILGEDRCYIVEIPKDYGKDITDYFISGRTKEDFEQLLQTAKVVLDTSKTNTLPTEPLDISWPAPLNERAFYGVVGDFIKTVAPHTEADPAALLLSFLIAFGSVIGNRARFRVEADSHPMRLFGVLVGKTAKGRKGTSWKYIENIFSKVDETWKFNIISGLSSGEGLIWSVRDVIYKSDPIRQNKKIVGYEKVIQDEGVSDKRALVYESEFASTLRVLGRDGNTLSAIVRNAWDTGNLQSLTKNNIAKATNAHISVLGHITKNELLRYLTDTEAGNEFGNRFLWFCVKRSKCLPFGGNIDASELDLLTIKLADIVDYAKQVDEMKWADDTKLLWAKVYSDLSEGDEGLVDSLTSRAEAYVSRLASIYALLDKTNLISPKHLLAAMAVWEYAEHSVRYIFQEKSGDTVADIISEALKNSSNGMTRTQISKLFAGNVSSKRISSALEIVEKLGSARKETFETNGRNVEYWFYKSGR